MELRDKNGLTEDEFLKTYKPGDYERPSLTADIVVFSESSSELKILLIKRGGHPYLGSWALPGGFAEKNECTHSTAKRELQEETGLSGLPLSEIGLFSKPGRDPRTWVVSDAFASKIPENRLHELKAADDAADADWFILSVSRECGILNLCFSSKNVKFNVRLKQKLEEAFSDTEFELIENGGLAFDHAEIIAQALKKFGYI